MQAAARQDAELLLQPERRLGVVPARQVHGDDAHAAAGLPCAAQADAGKRRDAVQKALAQRQLMAAKALDALLLHKGQRSAQTVDTRQIRRAGLQPVRQIRRQQLTEALPVPPATSGVRLAASSSVSSSAPMPLGPSRPLCPGTASAERCSAAKSTG